MWKKCRYNNGWLGQSSYHWSGDFNRSKQIYIKKTKTKQAVPINGDNIPPLWSVPTPSRNTQQIVLFLSHCGSYTGENLSIRSIFGHQRAKNEGTNTKIDRGPETYPISINPRDEMNRANSFREKLRKPRFSVNFWPPEGQKWGHEHENR